MPRPPRSRAPSAAAWLALSSAALAVPVAHADWTGKGEGGLLLSRGNSEATSGNVKLDLSREGEAWTHKAALAALYGRNAEFANAQRYEARYELRRELGARTFAFGSLRGERDLFSGFEYQATLSGGLGRKFIDTERTQLTGTLGAGYRRLRPQQLVKLDSGEVIRRIPGDATGDAVATAGLDYGNQLTATTRVTNKLLVEAGSENTSVANDLALVVSMTDRLALSAGYGVRYNTDPAPNTKKTDQVTTLNLVYKIE